jgi:hypothetical protein
MAAELLLLLLPSQHFATAGAAAAAAVQQQFGQVLRLLWGDALGCVTNAEGCYTGQLAVRLVGFKQGSWSDGNGQILNTHDAAAGPTPVDDITTVCASALAAVPAAAAAAAVTASDCNALHPVLQLALAAVETLLLCPKGMTRQQLLWCMCNKVPGTKVAADAAVDAAAAAAAAAAILDKLMAAQLLQQQQQQQSASNAGQQQLLHATAAGGVAAAAGVAAAVLPSSSLLPGGVSGACRVLLSPAFLELVFGTAAGSGYQTTAAAAAAAAAVREPRGCHSQGQLEAQPPAAAAAAAVRECRGRHSQVQLEAQPPAAAAAAVREGSGCHSQGQLEAQQPAAVTAAKLAVQDLRGCVVTACQYVKSQGAAGMQQLLLLQLLGLQHSSSVAEAVLGLLQAVGLVVASGSGPELKLRWC